MDATRNPEVQQETAAVLSARQLVQEVERLAELKRLRGETWREAVHELRNHFGVIKNATAVVTKPDASDAIRSRFLTMLQEGLASTNTLLTDLMTLATLEAGHEGTKTGSFDAAMLLRGMCEEMQILAAQRGLSLKAQGPASLPVEGDMAKVQRLAQNLVTLVFCSSERGEVTVSWEGGGSGDSKHWMLGVRSVDSNAEDGSANPNLQPLSARVSLSIARGLCELLGARMVEQTEIGQRVQGFQVIFPHR